MTDIALREAGWRITGRAQIDERPPVSCALTICADGTWSATLATFTIAGQVDLFLVSDEGGHFCGPASVERSRADSYPFAMQTDLAGVGPLLVVAPESALPDLDEMLDAEVVEEISAP